MVARQNADRHAVTRGSRVIQKIWKQRSAEFGQVGANVTEQQAASVYVFIWDDVVLVKFHDIHLFEVVGADAHVGVGLAVMQPQEAVRREGGSTRAPRLAIKHIAAQRILGVLWHTRAKSPIQRQACKGTCESQSVEMRRLAAVVVLRRQLPLAVLKLDAGCKVQERRRSKPARRQQEASKRPARGQQEASKRPGRGPKWGGPHETPKPLKNSHFHEENSPFSRAFPKNRFSREILVGKLEASKKPERGQEEASKRPARGQQEASSKPGRRQQEASKRPARGQEEAPNGGDPTKHQNH